MLPPRSKGGFEHAFFFNYSSNYSFRKYKGLFNFTYILSSDFALSENVFKKGGLWVRYQATAKILTPPKVKKIKRFDLIFTNMTTKDRFRINFQYVIKSIKYCILLYDPKKHRIRILVILSIKCSHFSYPTPKFERWLWTCVFSIIHRIESFKKTQGFVFFYPYFKFRLCTIRKRFKKRGSISSFLIYSKNTDQNET